MMSTVTAITDYHKRGYSSTRRLDSPACAVRENLRAAKKEFGKIEDDFKSILSVGQIKKEIERLEELEPEEVVDLEEINEPQGLRLLVRIRTKKLLRNLTQSWLGMIQGTWA